jgi:hypothetical protein
MSDPYTSRLAQDWIATFGNGPDPGPAERNPFGAFDAIVKGDPLYAWDLIVEVVNLDPAQSSWDILAAAPLEDLLTLHGDDMIDYIADQVERHGGLRELLRGVRQPGTSDAVWARITDLRGED